MIRMQYKHEQSLSQEQVNRLLRKYIAWLEMYFEALQEACQQAKKSAALHDSVNTSSINVIERFITIGRKIQNLLQNLQEKYY